MLSFGPRVRVFVVITPIDMRGSFDALVGAVRRLGLEPLDGHLYLFLNRRRRLCKIVWFDGSGLVVLAKRLERGTFELPVVAPGVTQVAVDGAMLTALLQGLALGAPRRRWYWHEAA